MFFTPAYNRMTVEMFAVSRYFSYEYIYLAESARKAILVT
jgi:hypothetical protein